MPAALLLPYSPLITPHTIRLHNAHLLSKGHVWWGRFSGDNELLTEAEARARWPHVAAFADALAGSRDRAVLFVTDHSALHACKISGIAFGNDPPGVRLGAPAYYEDRRVFMWFKIVDVRALSYDTFTTAEWFAKRTGPVKAGSARPGGRPYTKPFDLYAEGEHRYPIVLEAPSATDLFDATKPVTLKRWAEARDACAPRVVQKALAHLAKETGAAAWKALLPAGLDLLANALVTKNQVEQDPDVDSAMALTRIAVVVEAELRALLGELEALRDRLPNRRSPLAAALTDGLPRGSSKAASVNHDPTDTLGGMMNHLRDLARDGAQALDMHGLSSVTAVARDPWLTSFTKLRNPATHKLEAPKLPAMRAALFAFFEEKARPVTGIAEARGKVAKVERKK